MLRDLKVIRRGPENHLDFSGAGMMASQTPTEVKDKPQLLTCHSSQDLDIQYPDFPKVMWFLGLISRIHAAKPRDQSYAGLILLSLQYGVGLTPLKCGSDSGSLCIMAGSGAILGQFQQLEDI